MTLHVIYQGQHRFLIIVRFSLLLLFPIHIPVFSWILSHLFIISICTTQKKQGKEEAFYFFLFLHPSLHNRPQAIDIGLVDTMPS